MNKELYNELREIEDRLFLIREKIGTSLHEKLDYIWAELYDYLEEVEVKDE